MYINIYIQNNNNNNNNTNSTNNANNNYNNNNTYMESIRNLNFDPTLGYDPESLDRYNNSEIIEP